MNRQERQGSSEPADIGDIAATAERLFAAGRLAEAETAYQAALRADPANPGLANNYANLLTGLGRPAEAIPLYRRAIDAAPGFAEAHANLGSALMTLGAYEDAVQSMSRAVAANPGFYGFHMALGLCRLRQGRPELAVPALQSALALNPADATTHSSLLVARCYGAEETRASLAAGHREWARRHASGVARVDLGKVDRSPDRPLRIGYVSGDLRQHPVAFFLEPVLAARDKERFTCILYANQEVNDRFSSRLHDLADGWRGILRADDASVCRQIRADAIDILVDLSGHTGYNRLRVFAHRPAPVQVTWLGYPGSTGLGNIDYRITDSVADPADLPAEYSSEEPLRLAGGFHCYAPPPAQAAVAPPPMAQAGYATFGSFNNLAKLTRETVALWAGVLSATQGSRLLLKAQALSDPAAGRRLQAEFAALGIAPARIEVLPWTGTLDEHLASYARVDVALDSFPYNGTTTTFDAMWMGVPVVTMRGSTHMARVGASLLTHAGHPEWIGDDPSEFAAIASRLVANADALSATRAGLRDEIQRSPLMDARSFTAKLEAAYRDIWTRWCLGSGA